MRNAGLSCHNEKEMLNHETGSVEPEVDGKSRVHNSFDEWKKKKATARAVKALFRSRRSASRGGYYRGTKHDGRRRPKDRPTHEIDPPMVVDPSTTKKMDL